MQYRVDVSPWLFVVVWWSIAVFHTVCSGYHAIVGLVYLLIPVKAKSLLSNLELLTLSVPGTDMPMVGGIYMVVSSGYAYSLASMVRSSVRSRRLSFSRPPPPTRSGPPLRRRQSRLLSSIHRAVLCYAGWLPVKARSLARATAQAVLAIWRSFNMGSPNYGVVYVVREIVQTGLQINQAYRLSASISRPWMNNVIVVLLVVNCLVSPLIQFTVRLSMGHTRLLCVVANLALDMVTSIWFPLALALPYYSDFNPSVGNYAQVFWYTDTWIIQVVNEWKILFVSGWIDGCGRLFIAYNLGRSLHSIGRLIHVKDSSDSHSVAVIVPAPVNQERSHESKASTTPWITTGWRASVERWGHRTLVVCGLAVAVVHALAISTGDNPRCLVQVQPWFSSQPACSLMEISCNDGRLSGNASDFDAALDTIDGQWLAYLIIRHCPAVEITSRVHELSMMMGIKIYNATIVDWPQTAALTQTTNPDMKFVFIVQCNMSEVPPGLYHADFPSMLTDIELVATNLTSLPAELADVWPPGMFLLVEDCQFSEFPNVLAQLQPSYFSIASNNFSEVPVQVLENPRLMMLTLNNNPIQVLPPSLKIQSAIWWIAFVSTQIETLPDWLQVENIIGMMAGGTPLCHSLTQGNASVLGVHESKVNAWRTLVECTPAEELPFLTYYPTIYETA